MANLQNLEMFAGENRTFALAARDANNAPVNLTGGTVTWYVGRGPRWPYSPHPLITKTATLTTPASGLFTVSLAPSDTECAAGEYTHEAHLTLGGNTTVVCRGSLVIRATMEP